MFPLLQSIAMVFQDALLWVPVVGAQGFLPVAGWMALLVVDPNVPPCFHCQWFIPSVSA